MTNLIKVEQVKAQVKGRRDSTPTEYQPRETGLNILKQVLDKNFKFDEWDRMYQGIQFLFLAKPQWAYGDDYPLKGIQMSVGNYGQKVIKRVMVKNNEIDADELKSKFAELKAEADDLAERREESADYLKRSEALRDKIAKAVKHPDRYDFETHPKVDLDSHSPEEVKMEAHINGAQLIAIERILGEQSLEIELEVPEDKAVEVYNILKGDEEQ